MAKSFQNTVAAWTAKMEKQSLETLKDATRELTQEVRQAVPYETGNLSRSVVLAPDRNIPAGAPDEVFPDPTANDEAVLAGVKMGDKIALGVRAAYAMRQEVGYQTSTKVVPGTFAVTTAASRWQGIVRRAARDRGMKAK